jgi:hypothetical protein
MPSWLTQPLGELQESNAVATVVTLNGSAHVSAAWIGLDADEIVFGSLPDQRKLQNLRRDPRIVVSVQSLRMNAWGLREYVVLEGTARITEGGGPPPAHGPHLPGPRMRFPAMTDPPPGSVTHVRVERVTGVDA